MYVIYIKLFSDGCYETIMTDSSGYNCGTVKEADYLYNPSESLMMVPKEVGDWNCD